MRLRRPRLGRAALAACAAPVAALLSGLMVWHASTAAFTSATSNDGNSFATGEVRVRDNDAGEARFTVSNLKPGETVSHCTRIFSDSTVATSVKVYLGNVSSTRGMDAAARISVEEVDGEGGFMLGCRIVNSTRVLFDEQVDQAAARNDYTTGAGFWTPTPVGGQVTVDSRLYRVSFTLRSDAPNTVQGGTVRTDLVWEARTP